MGLEAIYGPEVDADVDTAASAVELGAVVGVVVVADVEATVFAVGWKLLQESA